jgi:hypothetical protein
LCRPDLFDFNKLDPSKPRENLEMIFNLVEKELGIPRLLDPEGLSCLDEM